MIIRNREENLRENTEEQIQAIYNNK
jgi:hypothetical protein